MKRFVHFLLLLGIWLLLTWSLHWQEVLVGVVVALIADLLLGDIFPLNAVKILSPVRFFWFLVYTVTFFFYVIKANFDVAYRVLNINLPIKPGIVKVRTKLNTEMARTFLANSITLTPGTLSVDIVGDHIYVHWINISTDDPKQETEIIVERFEKLLERVFE
ncbi:MAG: Na+/H+ antiporter subunit E [Candidatus Krumholzibacteriota bacterium]|nr:Na+/H+ antiporter subunit E [Candidatus Krumholzibacteriota bacterium]